MTALLPLFLEQLRCCLLKEFRRGPLKHIEVILDVAVAQHEVLVDLQGFQVVGRQGGHHVDVQDAPVGVLDIQVVGLLVQDRRCGVLVLVGPAPDLDEALQECDDQLGVLFARHIADRAGGRDIGPLQGPVRIIGQVLDGLDLARLLLDMLEDLALGVDRIDGAVEQRRLQRAEGQVVLVVALQPQLGRVLHRGEHRGIVVPVIRVGEFHDLHVVAGHVVQHQHQLDALLLLDAPPVVLDDVQALREADLLALQVLHAVDRVPGAHQHAAAFVDMGRANEAGAANVGLDVDGREAAAIAHQVVEVVDVVRIPVVLGGGAQEFVGDTDLLELFLHPTDLLVDVAGRTPAGSWCSRTRSSPHRRNAWSCL